MLIPVHGCRCLEPIPATQVTWDSTLMGSPSIARRITHTHTRSDWDKTHQLTQRAHLSDVGGACAHMGSLCKRHSHSGPGWEPIVFHHQCYSRTHCDSECLFLGLDVIFTFVLKSRKKGEGKPNKE